ncbi:MAG: hypothetical protein ACTHJW_29315 [Streptosporangiaceae bacterium]
MNGDIPPAVELAVCANATLDAASARLTYRQDTRTSRTDLMGREVARPAPGPLGWLTRRLFNAARERLIPDLNFGHLEGEGFLDPAASRYMLDFGAYAQVFADGQLFGGRSGRSLSTVRPAAARRRPDELLSLLRKLAAAADAYLEGAEHVGETGCRRYSMPTSATTTVTAWTDGKHVRRIRFAETAASAPARGQARLTVTKETTIDLSDFGVSLEGLDWSRLPGLRAPS